MGRPSLFNRAVARAIAHMATQGKTDKEIAKILGVSPTSIKDWKATYPDFLALLKKAKEVADDIVEASLFHRAVGYAAPEVKFFSHEGLVVDERVVLKHYPPDVTAQIFWLKNRRPDRWRESHVIETPDTPAATQAVAKLSFEDFCQKAGYPKPYPKQNEMREFVVKGGKSGPTPRLLLGARTYGKSMFSTMAGVAYEIYCDPSFTVLLTTKVEKNGRKMLKEISRILKANGVELETDNADDIRVKGLVGNNSSVTVVPVGSAGFRSLHPKLAIMDDPVVPGKVSEADREEVKTVYEEILKLTKNVAIIGQPVDFRDLYQYLRNIIETMEVPHGSIPELDEDLDVYRAAGVDEKSIQASYFLKVEPDGDATFHDIQRIDAFPAQDSIAFMDPSEGGDYTAVGIFTNHFQGMAIVGFAWKKRWDLCIPELKEIFKRFRVHKMGFEVNKHGTQPLDVLRQALHDIGVSVEGKYTHSNKETRIQLAAQYSKSLFLSKQSHPEYIRQVVEYSHDAKYDDCPDTIATFLEWAGRIRPPKAVKQPSKDL